MIYSGSLVFQWHPIVANFGFWAPNWYLIIRCDNTLQISYIKGQPQLLGALAIINLLV